VGDTENPTIKAVRPITTQVDDHELQLEQIELAIHRLAARLGKMEKLMAQLTTAAIAATAAFDAMKKLMEEQTGLEQDEHVVLFDQDAVDA
jgi:hypothetical protein